MTNLAYKPDSAPVLSVYLTVQDARKTFEFYQKAFGFTEQEKVEEDGKIVHAGMKFGEALIMFGPEGAYGALHKSPKTIGQLPTAGLYIYCPDTDAMYERAVKAGAKSLMEPQDSFWGDRICKVADPDGHEFMFGTLLAK